MGRKPKSINGVENTKSTLGKRVAKFKNVTTEENVDMFGAKVDSIWKAEIRKRNSKLTTMKEDFENAMIDYNQKLIEHEQAYKNSFLDIDETKVDSVDKRSAYVAVYEAQIAKALNNWETYKKAVEHFKNDYNVEVVNQLNKIADYESFLSFIE